MKKLIEKLKKFKNNYGSGLILVVVALGFIGILAGALLTAVGYVYRLKLYDYNARDNFYYVEQAMNEVYASIGNQTVECMQEAYQYTVDNMTYYDVEKGTDGAYTTKTNAEANADFRNTFMRLMYDKFYGNIGDNVTFVSTLDNAISNRTVQFRDYDYDYSQGDDKLKLTKKSDAAGISVILYDADGNVMTGAGLDKTKLDRIVVKNVALTRESTYNRSTASGDFTQTLSADIVIGRPNFEVKFNSINADYSGLFEYAVIADMGVDISQTDDLTISGNVYAAADFYNKAYNFPGTKKINYQYSVDKDGNINSNVTNPDVANDKSIVEIMEEGTYKEIQYEDDGKTPKIDGDGNVIEITKPLLDDEGNPVLVPTGARDYTIKLNPVTSKVLGFDTYSYADVNQATPTYTYFNASLPNSTFVQKRYDGVNDNSRYSGFYINGTNVNLISSMVIVPGTIAVMNSGRLNMFGTSANSIKSSEVWADNIILGGYSVPVAGPNNTHTYRGASALFNANLYIKDDLQLDSKYSTFKLSGSYYGYGDSSKRDNRVFIPMVDPADYRLTEYERNSDNTFKLDSQGRRIVDQYNGNTREHYNSSTIVINGEHTNLDLSNTDTIYIAGRSYVELSKKTETVQTGRNMEGDASRQANIDVKTFSFDGAVNDYRTGDSLSMKSNQLAYMPASYEGTPVCRTFDMDKDPNTGYAREADGSYTLNASGQRVVNGEEYVYYEATLPLNLQVDSSIFGSYFGNVDGEAETVPCIREDVSGKIYYFYDFKVAYELAKLNTQNSILTKYNYDTITRNDINNAEDMAERFIEDYQDACENDEAIGPYIAKIDDDSTDTLFEGGDITLPSNAANNKIYSSGAISAKEDVDFSITTAKNLQTDALNSLLETSTDTIVSTPAQALDLSDKLEKKYNYIKYALQNVSDSSPEAKVVDAIVGYRNPSGNEIARGIIGTNLDSSQDSTLLRGESAITPINTFMNFDKITPTTLIVPDSVKNKYAASLSPTGLSLGTTNSVYVSGGDITIYPEDSSGQISGIIIAKGDVIFDKTVKSFQGLIISGSKVFVADAFENKITSISASPEICRAVLNELQLVSDTTMQNTAKYVLSLFKAYENSETIDANSIGEEVTVDRLDYSSVLKYDNWTKDVE